MAAGQRQASKATLIIYACCLSEQSKNRKFDKLASGPVGPFILVNLGIQLDTDSSYLQACISSNT